MLDTNAKYHHLIPQTYLKAWANTSGTLCLEYNSNPGVYKQRNKKNIAGINHYHSIIAGMPMCTQGDATDIFAEAKKYTIKYQGNIISDPLKLNELYDVFDEWEVFYLDGKPAKKNALKDKIESVKIKDIESLWSTKYETKWGDAIKKIETKILNGKTDSIKEFDKDFLMRFFTSLDWRSFSSNEQFALAAKLITSEMLKLDEITIPKDERELSIFENAADYMRHCLLLKSYRSFLNDTGMIYNNAMENLKYTSFHFLIADGTTTFITSDNPAFIYKRNDGLNQGILPLTPKILLAQGKDSEKNGLYYISHITENAVKNYNKIIKENSNEFIILNHSLINKKISV